MVIALALELGSWTPAAPRGRGGAAQEHDPHVHDDQGLRRAARPYQGPRNEGPHAPGQGAPKGLGGGFGVVGCCNRLHTAGKLSEVMHLSRPHPKHFLVRPKTFEVLSIQQQHQIFFATLYSSLSSKHLNASRTTPSSHSQAPCRAGAAERGDVQLPGGLRRARAGLGRGHGLAQRDARAAIGRGPHHVLHAHQGPVRGGAAGMRVAQGVREG